MIKDLLRIRRFYNDLLMVINRWTPNSVITITSLLKSQEDVRGEWSVKFSSFLKQIGR